MDSICKEFSKRRTVLSESTAAVARHRGVGGGTDRVALDFSFTADLRRSPRPNAEQTSFPYHNSSWKFCRSACVSAPPSGTAVFLPRPLGPGVQVATARPGTPPQPCPPTSSSVSTLFTLAGFQALRDPLEFPFPFPFPSRPLTRTTVSFPGGTAGSAPKQHVASRASERGRSREAAVPRRHCAVR